MPTKDEPVQEFFSIGDVCALTDLKPHVLRYWESQFRFLNPAKNRSGNRVYQRREVELIMLVKHLLYTEKYTIDGARQRIEEQRKAGSLRAEARAALDVQMIRDLERQLQSIVRVLDGNRVAAVRSGERPRRTRAVRHVTSDRVVCVVPAFNAEPTIAAVVSGLRAAIPSGVHHRGRRWICRRDVRCGTTARRHDRPARTQSRKGSRTARGVSGRG